MFFRLGPVFTDVRICQDHSRVELERVQGQSVRVPGVEPQSPRTSP